jgi:hypothetical protein
MPSLHTLTPTRIGPLAPKLDDPLAAYVFTLLVEQSHTNVVSNQRLQAQALKQNLWLHATQEK